MFVYVANSTESYCHVQNTNQKWFPSIQFPSVCVHCGRFSTENTLDLSILTAKRNINAIAIASAAAAAEAAAAASSANVQ